MLDGIDADPSVRETRSEPSEASLGVGKIHHRFAAKLGPQLELHPYSRCRQDPLCRPAAGFAMVALQDVGGAEPLGARGGGSRPSPVVVASPAPRFDGRTVLVVHDGPGQPAGVVQLLLQVLEDGRLTDSLGRRVDFRNTILIMTSNVGAEILQRDNTMGFNPLAGEAGDFDKIKDKILDETKRVFKPEFLNRLTEIVIFQKLTRDNMLKIVDIELERVYRRLTEQEIQLNVTSEAKDFLIDEGYDDKFGARPLRRAIERYLEDNLAEAILRGDVKRGDPIDVEVSEDGKNLVFAQRESPEEVSPGGDAGNSNS